MARATGKPHGWNPGAIKRRSELIEASDAFSALRNEVVDRYIENTAGLVQANLPLRGILILAELRCFLRGEQRKRAEFLCPLFVCLAQEPGCSFMLVARFCRAGSPLRICLREPPEAGDAVFVPLFVARLSGKI